jgi:trimeric autotransporter adhesin
VGAQALGTNTTALGDNASATGNFGVAVGNNASASHTNSVAIGNGSTTSADNSVSVGSAGAERTISNVAAGTNATDVTNLQQVQEADAATLRSANAHADAGDARTLRNANAHADAGDARTLSAAQGYTDQRASETLGSANQFTSEQVSTLRKQAFAGIAQAAALAPLLPSAAGKTTVNVGAATFGGQAAVGMSFAHRLKSLVVSGGIGVGSGSKSLVKIGAGFEF